MPTSINNLVSPYTRLDNAYENRNQFLNRIQTLVHSHLTEKGYYIKLIMLHLFHPNHVEYMLQTGRKLMHKTENERKTVHAQHIVDGFGS